MSTTSTACSPTSASSFFITRRRSLREEACGVDDGDNLIAPSQSCLFQAFRLPSQIAILFLPHARYPRIDSAARGLRISLPAQPEDFLNRYPPLIASSPYGT